MFDGRADIEIAAFQTFAWRHQAACAYHHVVFNDGIVQNNCTHPDQHTIADADAVYVAAQHGMRPNGYVFGKRYFADDDGGLVDESGFADLGSMV